MSVVSQPLVKVVLTSFNRRELMRVAAKSVLNQSYPNIHLVIVDDASTDGSQDLAREFELQYPGRVTAVLKSQNAGISDSARLGIRAAPKADFVAVLNEDDHWLPEKIGRQLEHIQADPGLGLVFTEALVCDGDRNLTGELFSDVAGRFTTFDFADALRSNHSCASTHLMTAAIAEIVADTLPLDSCLVDYYTVLVAAGLSHYAIVDEPLAIYMLASTGLHAQTGRNRRDTTRARECVFARVPEVSARVGAPSAVRRHLGRLTADLALYSLREGDFGTWAWQFRRVLGQRSLMPILWLFTRSIRMLPGASLRLCVRRPERDPTGKWAPIQAEPDR